MTQNEVADTVRRFIAEGKVDPDLGDLYISELDGFFEDGAYANITEVELLDDIETYSRMVRDED